MAEAFTGIRLYTIYNSDFLRFLQTQPQFSLKAVEFVSQRMQQLQQKFEDLLFKRVSTRLATLLVRLSQEFKESVSNLKRITLKLTHQELADLIGASRESTLEIIAHFTKLSLVAHSPEGSIAMLN